MSQWTVASLATAELEAKRSRFVGVIAPVESSTAAADWLAEHRIESATHNCWAWRIDGGHARYSDDGEPAGSAGAPMLSVIDGAELERVVGLVVRYYGGTKLGVGGLVRAYGGALRLAIERAQRTEIVNTVCARTQVSFANVDGVLRLLAETPAIVDATEYTADGAAIALTLPREEVAALSQRLQDLTAGQSRLKLND